MYKINFNHLYYFLTIAKEGTIVKASKKLHITQPALSHQLKLLEQDLGEKLFDRVGKKLVINQNGEKVKEYATKIFRHSEEMLQFLKSGNNRYIKIIKIGTVPWISKDQTYDFLKPLLSSQHIKVEVYQKDLDGLLKDIQNDRLDLVLCDSPYSGRSKKLQGFRIELDQIVCVAQSKTGIKGKFPNCLNNKKVINYSEACMMADKVDDFLQRHDIEVDTIGAFTDTSLIRTAVERGSGIGFLPLSVVKQSLKHRTLSKLGVLDGLMFSLWAITKKDVKKDSVLYSLISRRRKLKK